jgi:hypothetical protein
MKKQYALKISRNTKEKKISVHPVTIAPPGAAPYRLKHCRYYAESLQLFPTRKEAENARAAELVAADFAEKSDEELYSILRESLDRVANFGITNATLCRLARVNHAAVRAYLYQVNPPNPRTVAKLDIISKELDRVANYADSLLPESGGCGNPKKSRGGREDIWMDAPNPPRRF